MNSVSGSSCAITNFPDLPLKSNTTWVTTTNVVNTPIRIAAANPNRIGFFIWNNSANSGYINFGTNASSAAPVAIIATFTFFRMDGPLIWTGEIWAIRNGAGTGNMVVTELLRIG